MITDCYACNGVGSTHSTVCQRPNFQTVDIIFDGPPGNEAGRFVECEVNGKSVRIGEWTQRDDGFWVLTILAAVVSR